MTKRREELLDDAKAAVTMDRGHGPAEDSFRTIGRLQDVAIGHWTACRARGDMGPSDAQQAGVLMLLMKMGRLIHNPSHRDTLVDIAGYAACLAEFASAHKVTGIAYEEVR